MGWLMPVAHEGITPAWGWGRLPGSFGKKDWGFRGAFADRRDENRFIFFSGVVA